MKLQNNKYKKNEMIEIELIIALGIIVIPIYIYNIVLFCVELYKISKKPKPLTLKQVLNKYIEDENRR